MKDQGSGSLRSPQLSLSPTILTFVQAFVLTRMSTPFQRAPSHNNAHGEWLAQSHTFLPSKSMLWSCEFFFFFVSHGTRQSGCTTKVRHPCPNTVPHGHVDRAQWGEGAAWPPAGPASLSRNYVIMECFFGNSVMPTSLHDCLWLDCHFSRSQPYFLVVCNVHGDILTNRHVVSEMCKPIHNRSRANLTVLRCKKILGSFRGWQVNDFDYELAVNTLHD